jgi:hypothetical protein
MNSIVRIEKLIREDKFLISHHARIRMFQRNVSTDDIKSVITNGEVIEEYRNDEPCPSVLMLGFIGTVPYHVVVAECEDHLRVITIYIPEEDKWIDYKRRR